MQNLKTRARSGKAFVLLVALYLASYLLPYFQIQPVVTSGWKVVISELLPSHMTAQFMLEQGPWYIVFSSSIVLLIFILSLILTIVVRESHARLALGLNTLAALTGLYWSMGMVISWGVSRLAGVDVSSAGVFFSQFGWGYYLSAILGFLIIAWLFRDIVYRNRMNGNKNGAFKFSLTAK